MLIEIVSPSGQKRAYEVVDTIPTGFFVWNIGENMGTDEYIPICESLRPWDKKCYSINTATLKAIKLSPEKIQLLRDAANYGITSLQAAEKAIKRCSKSWIAQKQKLHAEKTLAIFNEITTRR